jgi:hypothetical protein
MSPDDQAGSMLERRVRLPGHPSVCGQFDCRSVACRAGCDPKHRRFVPAHRSAANYMHPYSVAKMVSTLGYLYGRTVYLNMVAGGFKSDLSALDDLTPHDLRYSSSSVPTLVEQKELVIGSEVIFTHRDLCK